MARPELAVAMDLVRDVATSLLRVELSRLQAEMMLLASVPVLVVGPTLNPFVAISQSVVVQSLLLEVEILVHQALALAMIAIAAISPSPMRLIPLLPKKAITLLTASAQAKTAPAAA